MWLPKQPKTKLLGVLIDNQLLWREREDKALKAFDNQLRVLRKMSYLPSHLLEETYLKTVISRVTYRIGVWGSCSVATENLHIEAGRIIHKISKNYLDHEVLDLINW